jgi:hypothetical protein
MANENIRVCPTCGQSVNLREWALFQGMVEALWDVYEWCIENHTDTFKKSDVKAILDRHGSVGSVFHNWCFLCKALRRLKRGTYTLDLMACREFFNGTRSVWTVMLTDPLTGEVTTSDRRKVYEIGTLTKFLDDDGNYVAQYKDRKDGA